MQASIIYFSFRRCPLFNIPQTSTDHTSNPTTHYSHSHPTKQIHMNSTPIVISKTSDSFQRHGQHPSFISHLPTTPLSRLHPYRISFALLPELRLSDRFVYQVSPIRAFSRGYITCPRHEFFCCLCLMIRRFLRIVIVLNTALSTVVFTDEAKMHLRIDVLLTPYTLLILSLISEAQIV
jgi:hypothetical protein